MNHVHQHKDLCGNSQDLQPEQSSAHWKVPYFLFTETMQNMGDLSLFSGSLTESYA